MNRFALALILAAVAVAPAAAQPASGSNNTPAGGANRMGEGGQVDRRPDAGAAVDATPRQAPPDQGNRSGGPTSTPPANTTVPSPTGTPANPAGNTR